MTTSALSRPVLSERLIIATGERAATHVRENRFLDGGPVAVREGRCIPPPTPADSARRPAAGLPVLRPLPPTCTSGAMRRWTGCLA